MNSIKRLKTLSEFHRSRGLAEPEHPLISVVNYADVTLSPENNDTHWVFDFYSISLKRNLEGKIKYGQLEYDFDEGLMFFIAPGQVFSIQVSPRASPDRSGWILLIHPDFLWGTSLAKNIQHYDFFGYSVNEALFLAKKEEKTMLRIIDTIRHEYHATIDKFSQQIIVSQIQTLLGYSERFYERQFVTRSISNHQVLNRLEALLTDYFQNDDLVSRGMPTVQYISDQLTMSPNYLSTLLKVLTGLSTQQHIHEKLISIAKEKLSTTNLSISEVAYELGFDYPQSFSKLFKSKTNVSPVEFRKSFN